MIDKRPGHEIQCVPGDLVRMGGSIHLVLDAEHLLCGGAVIEAASDLGDESLRWHATTRKTVTCDVCIDLIRLCRDPNVRIPKS